MSHYKTSFGINSSAESVFEAISRKLGAWWGKQDKSIEEEGVIFTVSWGEPWYQFEVIQYSEGREMIWECVDANQQIEGLPGVEKEWVGTKIHWQVQAVDRNRSRLEFEHIGLVPDFLCFQFCSSTWKHFLEQGLVNYVTRHNTESK